MSPQTENIQRPHEHTRLTRVPSKSRQNAGVRHSASSACVSQKQKKLAWTRCAVCDTVSQTVYNTKGTRAHTHRELIRKWLWEPKESSLEYIYMLGGGVDAATLVAALGAGPPPPDCRWGRRPHRGATACRLLGRPLVLVHSQTILKYSRAHATSTWRLAVLDEYKRRRK